MWHLFIQCPMNEKERDGEIKRPTVFSLSHIHTIQMVKQSQNSHNKNPLPGKKKWQKSQQSLMLHVARLTYPPSTSWTEKVLDTVLDLLFWGTPLSVFLNGQQFLHL